MPPGPLSPLTGLILGLVHGLTEFLPVSSSGHLALVEHLLGVQDLSRGFDLFLHLATFLVAAIGVRAEIARILAFLASSFGIRWVSFRSDDLREGRRLFFALVIGTIPAAVVGFVFRTAIEGFFDSPRFVGFALLFTGAMLLATRLAPRGSSPLDAGSALAIGVAQALALVPGVSRTGLTVAAGLFAGVKRERVIRFSFLLSLPAVLGATILEIREGVALIELPPLTLALAFVAALVSGFVAMQLMLRVVTRGKLAWFGLYCIAAGVAALLLLPVGTR